MWVSKSFLVVAGYISCLLLESEKFEQGNLGDRPLHTLPLTVEDTETETGPVADRIAKPFGGRAGQELFSHPVFL